MNEENISLHEAASRTGLSEEKLHRLILQGELRADRVDDPRHYLIRLSDLEKYLPARAPRRCCAGKRFWLIAAVALTALVVGSIQVSHQCVSCGGIKKSSVIGNSTTIRSTPECPHQWSYRGIRLGFFC